MKLDALTSIKKDALDTNALKSISGGRLRMSTSGATPRGEITYSSDRVYQEEFYDQTSHTFKWAHYGTTYLND
jgi:hypothetical protein